MSSDLAQLLAEVDAILLDFDGPVCSIFAGYPAHDVAANLLDLLRHHNVDLPPGLASEADPLEVLRWTGSTNDFALTRAVEDALCAAERRAVDTAAPTPFGREVIVAARQAGLPIAVVSNNSAGAVTAYLVRQRLDGHVAHVIGRAYAEPTRMKPNPDPILRAAEALAVPPGRSVLIGDSTSDIVGARAAGTRAIAFANRPAKVDAFSAAGADVVITSMGPIAEELIRRYDQADQQSVGRSGR